MAQLKPKLHKWQDTLWLINHINKEPKSYIQFIVAFVLQKEPIALMFYEDDSGATILSYTRQACKHINWLSLDLWD